MYAGAIEQTWFRKQNNVKVDTFKKCQIIGLYQRLRTIDCTDGIGPKRTIRLLYNATSYDNEVIMI
jgi:hypothetical protein